MTRKTTSTIYGLMALFAAYVGIQFFQLQFQRNYDLINVTTYFSFFVSFMVLMILFYELIQRDRLIRMFFVFITIINLNYFIIAFFMRMIPSTVELWAGEVHLINMIFFTKEFSVATLIEYNIFFRLPMLLNISAMVILIAMILVRRK